MIRVASCHRHHAAGGLSYQIKRRAQIVRSVGPKAGNTAAYNFGVDRFQGVIVNTKFFADADSKVTDNHVAFSHQVIEHLEALLRFKVYGNAFFVLVKRQEIHTHSFNRKPGIIFQPPPCAFSGQWFHFYRFCSQIGQHH